MVGRNELKAKNEDTTRTTRRTKPVTPKKQDASPKKRDASPKKRDASPKKREASPVRPRRSPGRPPKAETVTVSTRSSARIRSSPSRKDEKEVRKSPSRKDEKATRKSPVRRKSPARRESARKSPSRKIIESSEKITHKFSTIILDTDSDSQSEGSETSSKVRLRRTPSREGSFDGLRRSTRINQVESVPYMKSHYEPIAKIPEYSDEDDWDVRRPTKRIPTSNYLEILNSLIFLVFYTTILSVLFVLCNDIECKFNFNHLERFKHIEHYFDLTVFLTFIAYLLFIAILFVLPFGGRKVYSATSRFETKSAFIANGMFSFVLSFAIMIALEYNHIPVAHYIVTNYFKLAVASYLASFLLAFTLLIKSCYTDERKLLPEATNRSKFLNFMYGAEMNPKLFNVLDVKLYTIRFCLITELLIIAAYLYHSIEYVAKPLSGDDDEINIILETLQSMKINTTVLAFSIMLFVYLFDGLVLEHTLVFMLEVKDEPTGLFKIMEYIAGTFVYGLMFKFASENDVQFDSWKLGVVSLLFLTGYIIYRGSNSQKHAFRENPYSPSVAGLESIPTSTGKRLLCSGYWGFVRHPNYLGDILMHLAFLQFVLCAPPALLIYFIILNLIARSRKDNKRCKANYGSAWDRYCQRVKYVLIPKLY